MKNNHAVKAAGLGIPASSLFNGLTRPARGINQDHSCTFEAVAVNLREKYPEQKITLAADDDQRKGHTNLTQMMETAQ